MTITMSIREFFKEKVQNIPCHEDTKAYIVSTFVGFKRTVPGSEASSKDLSDKSITIEYIQAQEERSFERYQQLGDWILFNNAMFPESLVVSDEYYSSIARLSYYKCYQIVNREWKLYEELADNFPTVVRHLHVEMSPSSYEPSTLLKIV